MILFEHDLFGIPVPHLSGFMLAVMISALDLLVSIVARNHPPRFDRRIAEDRTDLYLSWDTLPLQVRRSIQVHYNVRALFRSFLLFQYHARAATRQHCKSR